MSDTPKTKRNQHTLYPTDRLKEMVEAIRASRGYPSVAAVYFQGVIQLYEKIFPNYSVKRGDTNGSPEDIAKRKIAIKRAEKDAVEEFAIEDKKNICTVSLNGEIVDDGGELMCVFNTYHYGEADQQKVPLEILSEDFAAHQQIDPKG